MEWLKANAPLLLFLAAGGSSYADPVDADRLIRSPAGHSEIVVRTTARLAGAIDSLTWNGKEFIDSTDHGRQLQSACSFDNSPVANAETFNPTEAGSRRDGAGPRSTSRLLEIVADGSHLRTRTQMAFWLAPGERSDGQLARNTTVRSDYILTKEVRLGYRQWSQALDYRVTFTLPANALHKSAQFEALTGYMPAEFSQFWQFDPGSQMLEPLTDGPGEIGNPVVLATLDGGHAMGIFAPRQKGRSKPAYGRWRFTAQRVVKWNCVFREQNDNGLPAGGYSYRMLVAIGTLKDVEKMLQDWSAL
jgi:hypothetical protein